MLPLPHHPETGGKGRMAGYLLRETELRQKETP